VEGHPPLDPPRGGGANRPKCDAICAGFLEGPSRAPGPPLDRVPWILGAFWDPPGGPWVDSGGPKKQFRRKSRPRAPFFPPIFAGYTQFRTKRGNRRFPSARAPFSGAPGCPKWSPGGARGDQNGARERPKPEITRNADRRIFLPVSFCPCRRHFRSVLKFLGSLGGPLGPPGILRSHLGTPKSSKNRVKSTLAPHLGHCSTPGGSRGGPEGVPGSKIDPFPIKKGSETESVSGPKKAPPTYSPCLPLRPGGGFGRSPFVYNK
jgi:hypothetical protein